MPNKTIYIRESDKELWDKAETLAGGSVSGLLADALRRYVEQEERNKEMKMETIKVHLGGKNFDRDVSFVGEWLVTPDEELTRTAEVGFDAGAYYGVARTRRGNIAIYVAHVNDGFDADLKTYSSLEEAREDGWPSDILNEAARELDPDFVEQLDI